MSPWLLVSGDLPPTFTGGVASWVEDLARALVAGGHQVTVLGRAGPAQATAAEARWDQAQPFAVHRAWGRSWQRWGARWMDLRGRRLLDQVDHVVFATWPMASVLGPRARARGLPVAIAFHGSDLTRLPAPTHAFCRAIGAATALLPVSHFLGTELSRLNATATAVLPMPLPLPAASLPPIPLPATPASTTPDHSRKGLLCVARLTRLKGVDRAISLAHALDQPLTVIGDGPQAHRLRESAGPDVHFTGRLDRAQTLAWYGRSRACLLLSRPDTDGSGAEGLGLTLLEAQARGAVAIGSMTGGIPEAVGSGLALSDCDHPDLGAIQRLLDDPAAGVQAARWVAQHHGPDRARSVLEAALECKP